MLTVPLIGSGRVLGAFVSVRERPIEPDEADELTRRLDLLADVLAGALTRKEVEDALRGRDDLKSAILCSLGAGVAVLDRDGTIVTVSEAWAEWAPADGDGVPAEGENCLDRWRHVAPPGIDEAGAISRGIESVIDGVQPRFTCTFSGVASDVTRWLTLSVVRLAGPMGATGSVVVTIGPSATQGPARGVRRDQDA
jgi:PAS domain-containing protein